MLSPLEMKTYAVFGCQESFARKSLSRKKKLENTYIPLFPFSCRSIRKHPHKIG